MIGMYKETIGMRYNKYRVGDFFLRLKHYKNDVNILAKVDSSEIASQIRERLEEEAGIGKNGYAYNSDQFGRGGNRYDVDGTGVADTITINGIEYIRKK